MEGEGSPLWLSVPGGRGAGPQAQHEDSDLLIFLWCRRGCSQPRPQLLLVTSRLRHFCCPMDQLGLLCGQAEPQGMRSRGQRAF